MDELIDYDIVGKNIKRIIKAKGKTQKDIEKECNLYHACISNTIRGIHSMSITRLQDIAYALEVDVREFFKTENDEDILGLYYGMSKTMQKSILEIMKVTQEGE